MKVYNKILKESLKIVIIASILGSIGGIAAASVYEKIVLILPLLILLPALTNMIGSFGSIISSHFTTELFTGKVDENWQESKAFSKLYRNIAVIAVLISIYVAVAANIISYFYGFSFDVILLIKIIFIALLAVSLLLVLMLFVSVFGGLMIFKKNEDPNNFLIPINTALGDLGGLVIFAILVSILF